MKLELNVGADGKVTSAKVLCTKLSKAATECIRKVFLDASLGSGPGKMVIGGPC